jgi:hypothetical protein
MKNNFPKIPLIFSAIFFCLSLVAFLFFYKAIGNNNKESQLREAEWQTETNRRNEIKTLDNSVKMIEGEKIQLETHFAKSSDIVPFLDTIEGLAFLAGANGEITPPIDILPDHAGLMIGMKASGTFGSLYKFLMLLENSPYELEFMALDMRKGATANVWDITLKMKLVSFVE